MWPNWDKLQTPPRKKLSKKPKTQEKTAKPIQPFWRGSTSSPELVQIPKMPQKEQQTEEENITQEVEREENPEQTIQIKKSKSETGEETKKEEEKEEMIDEPEKKEDTHKRRYKMGKGEKTNPKLNKKPQKTKLAGSQHNGD